MHSRSCRIPLTFSHRTQIWEPVLLELIKQRETTHASDQIAEIWAWEAVNHGDSYLLNEQNLGGICT